MRKLLILFMAVSLVGSIGVMAYGLDLGAGFDWQGEDLELTTRLDVSYFSLEAPVGTNLGSLTPGAKVNLGAIPEVGEVAQQVGAEDAYVMTKINMKIFDNSQKAVINLNSFKVGLGMPPLVLKQFKVRGEFFVVDPLDDEDRNFNAQLVIQHIW